MDWPHTVSLWQWQGDSSIVDIPCHVYGVPADRLLPPSEYANLGRTQRRLRDYAMRCPLWVYPYMQELAPVAITQADSGLNPFGRDFDATSEGESLFIRTVSIEGGVCTIGLSAVMTNPLGTSVSDTEVPNQPTIVLPPKPVPIPTLNWYWLAIASQPFIRGFDASTGLPTSLAIEFKAKILFTDSVLNPITNIRNEGVLATVIQERYSLPTDINEIKMSVIGVGNRQYNMQPFDTLGPVDFVSNQIVTTIDYTDTGIDGTIGQLGFDIFCRSGANRSFRNYPDQIGSAVAFWVNGVPVVLWHNTNDARNNQPYYANTGITSEWGDTDYTVS